MDEEYRPASWLDRFLSARQPTLPVVSLGVVAFALGLAAIERSEPGREALSVVGASWESSIFLRAALVISSWLFSTAITHLLARLMGLRVPFLPALRIMGRAWLLYASILIMVDAVLIALVSAGWAVVAQLWHVSVGQAGGLLWVFFYPAAVSIAYGPQARSCLITFLTLVILLLMVGISAYLFFVVLA